MDINFIPFPAFFKSKKSYKRLEVDVKRQSPVRAFKDWPEVQEVLEQNPFSSRFGGRRCSGIFSAYFSIESYCFYLL